MTEQAKHTPGPWQRAGGFTIKAESGRHIAKVGALHLGPEEDLANARLIAAAPDLLEAAECILSDLNAIMPPELVRHFGASRMKLRAAITRATGGSES